jgi:hypothetical protein
MATYYAIPSKPGDPPFPGDDYDPQYLRKLHPVPFFDDHIKMARERHIYELDGEDLEISTTGNIKQFVGEFDADTTAARVLLRMRKYERDHPNGVTRDTPAWLVAQHKRYGHCRTVEELKHAWNVNRDKGTFVHRLLELYYNGDLNGVLSTHSALQLPEFKQFLNFDRREVEAKGYVPFRTEFTMYKLEIGGQIDMLYQRKEDVHATDGRQYDLWMNDWKKKHELGNHGDPLRPPFADMMPGDRTKFTIQLNSYKNMIETQTPYRIRRMTILMVSHELANYQMEEVGDISSLIEIMFEMRRKTLFEKKCQTAAELILFKAQKPDATDAERHAAVSGALKLITRAAGLIAPPKAVKEQPRVSKPQQIKDVQAPPSDEMAEDDLLI